MLTPAFDSILIRLNLTKVTLRNGRLRRHVSTVSPSVWADAQGFIHLKISDDAQGRRVRSGTSLGNFRHTLWSYIVSLYTHTEFDGFV